jgi:hypothetical protein
VTYPINATPEPPNCPTCGKPVHVEWCDVTRLGDRIPHVTRGNTYCLTRGCKAEWFCDNPECPGHPHPGGLCWPEGTYEPSMTREDRQWIWRMQKLARP